MGPDLLKFIPGEKASDLRTWLESYRYWNQGGMNNVKAMLQLITQRWLLENQNADTAKRSALESIPLPELEVTPDIGLLHPLLSNKYGSDPKSCESKLFEEWHYPHERHLFSP